MGKSHLFLKNLFGSYPNIRTDRGRSDNDISSDESKNYRYQKNNLHQCSESFQADLGTRHELRSTQLNLEHIDMISIDLLMVVNDELLNAYNKEYGLSAVNFFNMNQTVLFAVSDERRFKEVFLTQIEKFFEEDDDTKTVYKLLTYISGFKYWDFKQMLNLSLKDPEIHDVLLEMVDYSTRMVQKQKGIENAMANYFKDKAITFSQLDSGIYQIDRIQKDDLIFLLNNYDVIQRVEALYTFRAKPNLFGEKTFETEATLNVLEGAPTIGIIDTGVHRIPILESIIEEPGLDLVDEQNPQPYKIQLNDDSSHGTTVATLASFGNNFYRNISSQHIDADAKVFSIKVQRGDVGQVNIAGVKKAIIDAYTNYGIRIFNLSMTVRSKSYNDSISTYAYLLDLLAYEYDLLIFIAVGNLDEEDIINIQNKVCQPHTESKVRQFLTYPNHYYNPFISLEDTECHDGECMNLCEPSESMNNISVGAIARSYNDRHANQGLTLGKEFPAYYSRKYYMDYNALIHNTRFKNNQKNKNLFKPDIVMPGGDQLDVDTKMLVLAPNRNGTGLSILKNSGTSYATPLAANIAAKIIRKYPFLKMQTVKAIIINSADAIDSHFLDDTIDNLKKMDNCLYPDVDKNEKTKLSKKYNADRLARYISGYGIPNITKCLESDNRRCTFVIEDTIGYNSHKVVNLNIPEYLLRYTKKGVLLTLTGTLCFKFKPIRTNVLSYCPLHISFNFGNSMNYDDPNKNAEEYAMERVAADNERMAIKSNLEPWSEDFYPASSKMFSNVQKMKINISKNEIEKINNQMSVIFRCTGRDGLDGNHPFSFVLTIEQKQADELDEYDLYNSLEQINRAEAISQVNLEAQV